VAAVIRPFWTGEEFAVPAINEWLAGLGLGEYASRFAENDIDYTILSDLTDQDLEKSGVASLGHRRKILRAIAALDGATASFLI